MMIVVENCLLKDQFIGTGVDHAVRSVSIARIPAEYVYTSKHRTLHIPLLISQKRPVF